MLAAEEWDTRASVPWLLDASSQRVAATKLGKAAEAPREPVKPQARREAEGACRSRRGSSTAPRPCEKPVAREERQARDAADDVPAEVKPAATIVKPSPRGSRASAAHRRKPPEIAPEPSRSRAAPPCRGAVRPAAAAAGPRRPEPSRRSCRSDARALAPPPTPSDRPRQPAGPLHLRGDAGAARPAVPPGLRARPRAPRDAAGRLCRPRRQARRDSGARVTTPAVEAPRAAAEVRRELIRVPESSPCPSGREDAAQVGRGHLKGLLELGVMASSTTCSIPPRPARRRKFGFDVEIRSVEGDGSLGEGRRHRQQMLRPPRHRHGSRRPWQDGRCSNAIEKSSGREGVRRHQPYVSYSFGAIQS